MPQLQVVSWVSSSNGWFQKVAYTYTPAYVLVSKVSHIIMKHKIKKYIRQHLTESIFNIVRF